MQEAHAAHAECVYRKTIQVMQDEVCRLLFDLEPSFSHSSPSPPALSHRFTARCSAISPILLTPRNPRNLSLFVSIQKT